MIVLCTGWMGPYLYYKSIKFYEIHKICLKFKLNIKFRYILGILVIYTYILLKIKIL
jgi:hypothetical protein